MDHNLADVDFGAVQGDVAVSKPGAALARLYRTVEQAEGAAVALIESGVNSKVIDIVDRASDAPVGTPGESFLQALDRWFPGADAAGYGRGFSGGHTLVHVDSQHDVSTIAAILDRFSPMHVNLSDLRHARS